MLTSENIEEIFLAFAGTGDLVPSHKLLSALSHVCGKTEKELHEQYRELVRSLAGTTGDPFEH